MRFRSKIPRPKADELRKIKPTDLFLATDPLELAQFCRLIQSIRNNDRRTVESLMQKGIPGIADYVHPTEGETALGLAASKNDDAMIRFLLDLGASPSVVDLKGRSAAMRAAEMGFVEAMDAVAEANCDMKLIDEDGKGVLFYCLCPTRRHLKCAEIAISHGADVNNVCVQGLPVFIAACEGAKDAEQLCLDLLEAGADPKIADTESRRTAVMAAAASGSAKVLKAILDAGGNVNEIMSRGKFHALHEAAKSGCFECMKIMAAYGADFNQQTDRGFSESLTPIHITAAARDDPNICTFLGQRGCNAKLKNRDGETARQLAKVHFFKQTAKACRKVEKLYGPRAKRLPSWKLALHDFCYVREEALLEEFAKLDPETKCTVTRHDFEDVLRSFGAPIPGQEYEEEWINLLAQHTAKNKEIDYLTFLMAKKYIPKKFQMTAFEPKRKKEKKKKKEKKEKTTIPICLLPQLQRPKTFVPRHVPFTDHLRFDRDHAPEHPLEDDSAWYLDRPMTPGVEMNNAVRHEDRETLTRVIDANRIQAIVPDRFYKSPLAVAAAMGNLDMVRLLVENGANVNQKDEFLWTPLHLACHSGKRNVVDYLLDQGAKVNVASLNKATPIMKAIESCSPDVVQLMIDRGAEVRVEDRAALTPLELAACFADYAVFSAVKRKEDSLPPVKENRNKPRPTKKQPPKPIVSTVPQEVLYMQSGGAETDREDEDDTVPLRHRPSLLEPATSLSRGYPHDDDVTYTPRQVWTTVQSTEELIVARRRRRWQYGWMVDFEDFLMPFNKNIVDKVDAIEAEDAIYNKKRPVQMIKRPATALKAPAAVKAKGGPMPPIGRGRKSPN